MNELWKETVINEINAAYERVNMYGYDRSSFFYECSRSHLKDLIDSLDRLHFKLVYNSEAASRQCVVDVVLDEESISGARYVMERTHEMDMERMAAEYAREVG